MESKEKDIIKNERATTLSVGFILPAKIGSKELDVLLEEKVDVIRKKPHLTKIVGHRKLIKKRFYYSSSKKGKFIEILWIDPKFKSFYIDISGSLIENKIDLTISFPKRKNTPTFKAYAKVVIRALRLLNHDFPYALSFTKRYTSEVFLETGGDKEAKEYLLSKRNIKNFILKYGMKNKAFRNIE